MVGHSGVGKSTLVNRLVPDADRAVGVVSAIGKGRHTSTSAVALRLPRSGGATRLDHRHARASAASAWPTSSADSLLHGFPDLVEGTGDCPPNCDHTGATATAPWTPGSPRATPTRAGWPRTAGCSPPAPATTEPTGTDAGF